ncbi:hypothetical protein CVT24_000639 [Panaeolus cyanescens]|uniref:Uncharacterized protein n=1 Tax=Panaeolus cyanescens TaxID=181874 RepID=A0A409WP97_9AGAR|nr:hypothetical protein CVT24_000639 [Panaeolus cyanescens]
MSLNYSLLVRILNCNISFFHCLRFQDILLWRNINKTTRNAADLHINSMLDLSTALRFWFTPLETLLTRGFMQQNGMLLSGPFALNFVRGKSTDDILTLHFYVVDHLHERFHNFLTLIGYELIGRSLPVVEEPEITCAHDYLRNERCVQVIRCPISPLITILGFKHSVMMNFVTSQSVYVLFARGSLRDYKTLVLRDHDSRLSVALSPHHNAEYLSDNILMDGEHPMSTFSTGLRKVGDGQTFVWKLHPPLPCSSPSFIEGNAFLVRSAAFGSWKPHIAYAVIQSRFLKWSYTYPPTSAFSAIRTMFSDTGAAEELYLELEKNDIRLLEWLHSHLFAII